MFSYEALRSRLAEGKFGREGVKDMLAPIIRLEPLTAEEMLVLVEKLAEIHAGLFEYEQSLTQQDLVAFIEIEFGRIGAGGNITPREVIRDFIELMNIVCQNPEVDVRSLLGSDSFAYARTPVEQEAAGTDFAEFEL